MQYVHIQVKDGERVLDSTNKKFIEVFGNVQKEIELLKNSNISSTLEVDIYDNKIRIGIDEITAEDILVLNQKTAERQALIQLFTGSFLILLNQKSTDLVVNKEHV